MKRISQKMLTEFIDKVADLRLSDIPNDDGMCYYSKKDGAYFTREGDEKYFKFLLKKGITEELQDVTQPPRVVCLGYNPIEEKWYGWSHRAVYGFGIGSTCEPGDCAFIPSNKEEFKKDCMNFWKDEYRSNVSAKHCVNWEGNGELGVQVSWTYNDMVPNKSLRGTTNNRFEPYPDEFGKGRWTATTLDEAKEMAIDFARGVS